MNVFQRIVNARTQHAVSLLTRVRSTNRRSSLRKKAAAGLWVLYAASPHAGIALSRLSKKLAEFRKTAPRFTALGFQQHIAAPIDYTWCIDA
jgi:hypothetical protein